MEEVLEPVAAIGEREMEVVFAPVPEPVAAPEADPMETVGAPVNKVLLQVLTEPPLGSSWQLRIPLVPVTALMVAAHKLTISCLD